MTTRRPEPPTADLHRFGRTVRWVHAAVGALVLVLILTAAVLYNGSLAVLVGNRDVVERVHVWSGFALPAPLLLGLVARAYRDDLGRLNRFTPGDWRWLRARGRRSAAHPVGKFNAGQKLNTAVSGGAVGALLLTGWVMNATGLTRLAWRTGATFVHDWAALGLGLLVVGHLSKALHDPEAMRGIRTGWVSRRWAEREHPAWAGEEESAHLSSRDSRRSASGLPPV